MYKYICISITIISCKPLINQISDSAGSDRQKSQEVLDEYCCGLKGMDVAGVRLQRSFLGTNEQWLRKNSVFLAD